MTEKVKIQLSNFRVEEWGMERENCIAIDVEAQGKKGKITISITKLAIACLSDPTETIRNAARRVLREKAEEWAREKGLVKEPSTQSKLLEELIERDLKGIRSVEVECRR